MDTFMNICKRMLVLGSIAVMAAAFAQGCGSDRDEQAAMERQPEPGRASATAERAQGESGQAGQMPTAQTRTGENWTGKQVVGNDGRILGTVAEHNPAGKMAGYVLIKADAGKLHPVPTSLLNTDTLGDRLRASFDQSTFQNSPAYSEAEHQKLSEGQQQEVRGYYGNRMQESTSSRPQLPERSPQTTTEPK
jgi:hypothetical protein